MSIRQFLKRFLYLYILLNNAIFVVVWVLSFFVQVNIFAPHPSLVIPGQFVGVFLYFWLMYSFVVLVFVGFYIYEAWREGFFKR